jgi:ATP-dependent DNA helicase RecG
VARSEEPKPARPGEDLPGAAAARALEVLVPPLRFAVKDGFAGAPRLKGFGTLVAGAVGRARASGAADSPALRGLAGEGERFDALPAEARREALGRVAAHLSALVPVPEELRELARSARVGMMGRTTAVRPGGGEAADDLGKQEVRGRGTSTSTSTSTSTAGGSRVASASASTAGGSRVASTSAVGGSRIASANAGPTETVGEESGSSARPPPPEPTTAAERARRRKLLATRLAELPKAHPAPRAQLEERGRATVEEALEFWPKAYQDRTVVKAIGSLALGDEATVIGTVRQVRVQRMRNGRPILKVGLADDTGQVELVFFNAPPWRLKGFAAGDPLLATGKVTEGFGARRQLTGPEVEKVQRGDSANFGRIVPLYAGPTDSQHPALRKLMKRLCDEAAPWAVDELPKDVRARRALLDRGAALAQAHFPPPETDPLAAAERATPAFRRVIFEELFFLQLALALRRRGVRTEAGIAFDTSPPRVDRALRLLPFALTGSQRKVLDEVLADMAAPEPMNRLLQGDVGSGKTAVAFAAAMVAVGSGFQAAIMAPTEILAAQHARTLAGWLQGTGVEVALVGAQARGKAQRDARERVARGDARIAVGTHALIEEAIAFEKLGLVVVDEQHRFGVMQRAALIGKGGRPDVLVMTATPIPRTLALAFYGDLDQSKITELPPGRTPVETRVFGDSQRKRAYDAARKELEAGRQAYVVYPLVAESEKSDLADATTGAEELARVFEPHAVGLLHGQMKGEEKAAVMNRFRAGAIRVLVATTVIEVGVDVPNASVMIVEHAERFGLSQLHQLRGRVGRGAARSFCLLLAHYRRAGEDARERLAAMAGTQDGFELARVDLKLRGPGELLGTRQSGQKLLEVADLYRDEAILEEAREEAFALVTADPELARPEHAAASEALRERWAGRLSLAQVG